MKNKIALVIGYGSIGRLHANVLKKLNFFDKIYILSSQNISKFTNIKYLNKIVKINPYYIVISSKTNLHYSQLKFINKKFKDIKILVEKPLFHKNLELPQIKNKIFLGYDLRFHPLLLLIKKLIIRKKIWSINIICGSYLPEWRKNINYKNSYSSNKKYGGGVLLDLSHEIDYLNWIFGIIKPKYVFSKKISNLKISSDDTLSLIGEIKKIHVNLSLNYYTRKPIRQIIIDGKHISITADIIKNEINYKLNNKSYFYKYNNINREYTYKEMHKTIILNKNAKNACTFKEGKKVLTQIEKIQNTK